MKNILINILSNLMMNDKKPFSSLFSHFLCGKSFFMTLATNIGNWLLDKAIWFLYTIVKFVLLFVDIIFSYIQELCGLDMDFTSIETLFSKESDMVFNLLISGKEEIVPVIKNLIVLVIIMIIVFTIIALIKSQFEAMHKGSPNKISDIFKKTIKAFVLLIITPMIALCGIVFSDLLLQSLYSATNLSGSITIGTQIFASSTSVANVYRNYADNGVRIPITFDSKKASEATIASKYYEDKEITDTYKKYLQDSNNNILYYTYQIFTNEEFFDFDNLNVMMSSVSSSGKYYEFREESDTRELYYDTCCYDSFYEEDSSDSLLNNFKDYRRIEAYKEEYYVMADVVDYAVNTGTKLYFRTIEDILDSIIEISDETVQTKLLTNLINRCNMHLYIDEENTKTTVEDIRTEYKNDNWIAIEYYSTYFASDSSGEPNIPMQIKYMHVKNSDENIDEAYGSKFLIVVDAEVELENGKVQSYYEPLVNNYENYNGVEFISDHINKGQVIAAKGVFKDSKYPTAIKKSSEDCSVAFYREEIETQAKQQQNTLIFKIGTGAKNGFSRLFSFLKMIFNPNSLDSTLFISEDIGVLEYTTTKTYVSVISKGELQIGYFMLYNSTGFSPGYTLKSLFVPSKINMLLLVGAAFLLAKTCLTVFLGLIQRSLELFLIIAMYPVACASIPIDDQGYDSWWKAYITRLFQTYGLILGINFVLMLFPIVTSMEYFTQEDIGRNITVYRIGRLFFGFLTIRQITDMFNFVTAILFELVAFTLLDTVPKLINKIIINQDGEFKNDALESLKAIHHKIREFMKISGKVALAILKFIPQSSSAANAAAGIDKSKKAMDNLKKITEFKRKLIPGSALLKSSEEKQMIRASKKAKQDAEADFNDILLNADATPEQVKQKLEAYISAQKNEISALQGQGPDDGKKKKDDKDNKKPEDENKDKTDDEEQKGDSKENVNARNNEKGEDDSDSSGDEGGNSNEGGENSSDNENSSSKENSSDETSSKKEDEEATDSDAVLFLKGIGLKIKLGKAKFDRARFAVKKFTMNLNPITRRNEATQKSMREYEDNLNKNIENLYDQNGKVDSESIKRKAEKQDIADHKKKIKSLEDKLKNGEISEDEKAELQNEKTNLENELQQLQDIDEERKQKRKEKVFNDDTNNVAAKGLNTIKRLVIAGSDESKRKNLKKKIENEIGTNVLNMDPAEIDKMIKEGKIDNNQAILIKQYRKLIERQGKLKDKRKEVVDKQMLERGEKFFKDVSGGKNLFLKPGHMIFAGINRKIVGAHLDNKKKDLAQQISNSVNGFDISNATEEDVQKLMSSGNLTPDQVKLINEYRQTVDDKARFDDMERKAKEERRKKVFTNIGENTPFFLKPGQRLFNGISTKVIGMHIDYEKQQAEKQINEFLNKGNIGEKIDIKNLDAKTIDALLNSDKFTQEQLALIEKYKNLSASKGELNRVRDIANERHRADVYKKIGQGVPFFLKPGQKLFNGINRAFIATKLDLEKTGVAEEINEFIGGDITKMNAKEIEDKIKNGSFNQEQIDMIRRYQRLSTSQTRLNEVRDAEKQKQRMEVYQKIGQGMPLFLKPGQMLFNGINRAIISGKIIAEKNLEALDINAMLNDGDENGDRDITKMNAKQIKELIESGTLTDELIAKIKRYQNLSRSHGQLVQARDEIKEEERAKTYKSISGGVALLLKPGQMLVNGLGRAAITGKIELEKLALSERINSFINNGTSDEHIDISTLSADKLQELIDGGNYTEEQMQMLERFKKLSGSRGRLAQIRDDAKEEYRESVYRKTAKNTALIFKPAKMIFDKIHRDVTSSFVDNDKERLEKEISKFVDGGIANKTEKQIEELIKNGGYTISQIEKLKRYQKLAGSNGRLIRARDDAKLAERKMVFGNVGENVPALFKPGSSLIRGISRLAIGAKMSVTGNSLEKEINKFIGDGVDVSKLTPSQLNERINSGNYTPEQVQKLKRYQEIIRDQGTLEQTRDKALTEARQKVYENVGNGTLKIFKPIQQLENLMHRASIHIGVDATRGALENQINKFTGKDISKVSTSELDEMIKSDKYTEKQLTVLKRYKQLTESQGQFYDGRNRQLQNNRMEIYGDQGYGVSHILKPAYNIIHEMRVNAAENDNNKKIEKLEEEINAFTGGNVNEMSSQELNALDDNKKYSIEQINMIRQYRQLIQDREKLHYQIATASMDKEIRAAHAVPKIFEGKKYKKATGNRRQKLTRMLETSKQEKANKIKEFAGDIGEKTIEDIGEMIEKLEKKIKNDKYGKDVDKYNYQKKLLSEYNELLKKEERLQKIDDRKKK